MDVICIAQEVSFSVRQKYIFFKREERMNCIDQDFANRKKRQMVLILFQFILVVDVR
jgi:hypothetical protein